MKKQFEQPEMELIRFSVADIVTNSIVPGEDELPGMPLINLD